MANKNHKFEVFSKYLAVLSVSFFAIMGIVVLGSSMAATNEDKSSSSSSEAQTSIGTSLYFSPDTGTYNVGNEITVDVKLNTSETSISKVVATFVYDSSYIEVTNISDTGSSFDVAKEAQINNDLGKVTIVKTSSGGVGGDALIARVTMVAKNKTDMASLRFDPVSQVIKASDSENVLQQIYQAKFQII